MNDFINCLKNQTFIVMLVSSINVYYVTYKTCRDYKLNRDPASRWKRSFTELSVTT